jgi:hypothetical protein
MAEFSSPAPSFPIAMNGVGAPLRSNLHRIDGIAITTLVGKILNEHRGTCGTQLGLC